MARRLSTYHGSFVRRGRQQKGDLDAAMSLLADVYLRLTGCSGSEIDIKFAPNSRFIRFAVLALEPAAQHFEVTPGALSERWRRRVRPPGMMA